MGGVFTVCGTETRPAEVRAMTASAKRVGRPVVAFSMFGLLSLDLLWFVVSSLLSKEDEFHEFDPV